MPRVCIVIVYFGDWPQWFSAWLRSCETNPQFHWLIFSDAPSPCSLPVNVRIELLTTTEFEQQVSEMLSARFVLSRGYKLVDLKPAYGELFVKHLQDYEFWGYTDLDVIYGRLAEFFTRQRLLDHDILSPSDRLLVGHLTLVRNSEQFRKLYRLCPDYLNILCRDTHEGFDEKGFHRQVMSLAAEGSLRLFLQNMKQEDILLRLNGRGRFLIVWHLGRLYDCAGFRQICHFHFMESKWRKNFRVASIQPDTKVFFVTPEGIGPSTSFISVVLLAGRTVACLISSLPFYVRSLLRPMFRRTVPKIQS